MLKFLKTPYSVLVLSGTVIGLCGSISPIYAMQRGGEPSDAPSSSRARPTDLVDYPTWYGTLADTGVASDVTQVNFGDLTPRSIKEGVAQAVKTFQEAENRRFLEAHTPTALEVVALRRKAEADAAKLQTAGKDLGKAILESSEKDEEKFKEALQEMEQGSIAVGRLTQRIVSMEGELAQKMQLWEQLPQTLAALQERLGDEITALFEKRRQDLERAEKAKEAVRVKIRRGEINLDAYSKAQATGRRSDAGAALNAAVEALAVEFLGVPEADVGEMLRDLVLAPVRAQERALSQKERQIAQKEKSVARSASDIPKSDVIFQKRRELAGLRSQNAAAEKETASDAAAQKQKRAERIKALEVELEEWTMIEALFEADKVELEKERAAYRTAEQMLRGKQRVADAELTALRALVKAKIAELSAEK